MGKHVTAAQERHRYGARAGVSRSWMSVAHPSTDADVVLRVVRAYSTTQRDDRLPLRSRWMALARRCRQSGSARGAPATGQCEYTRRLR